MDGRDLGSNCIKEETPGPLREIAHLRRKITRVRRQRDEITQTLAEIEAELVHNNFSFEKVMNYAVRILRRGE